WLNRRLLSPIKRHARGSAAVRMKSARAGARVTRSRVLRVASEEADYSSPQEQQTRVLADLFGYDESIQFTKHDDVLLAASREARKRLPELMEMFNNGLETGYSLLLKAPFKTDDGGNEWMWIEVTKWDEEGIEGILQNEPYNIPDLKSGA